MRPGDKAIQILSGREATILTCHHLRVELSWSDNPWDGSWWIDIADFDKWWTTDLKRGDLDHLTPDEKLRVALAKMTPPATPPTPEDAG